MKVFDNPDPSRWPEILKRPTLDTAGLDEQVAAILHDVRQRGDSAVRDYTEKFDGIRPDSLRVGSKALDEAESLLNGTLKDAIRVAYDNIERFHRSQLQEPLVIETMPGVRCWRKSVGIEKVGLYIPGGTAPLFSSVLMLGIPARLAACREIVLCSPPGKDGKLHPAILYAAKMAGIEQVFRIGGVQAIGAMAYGTGSVPAVYKIFGPGNQYVTAAKQRVAREGLAIDMPAGPSEVLVCAGPEANADFVAADLLSQAEHGADSQVVLIAWSVEKVEAVQSALERQLPLLPRRAMAARALEHSVAVIVADDADAIRLINHYAPEHLILALDKPGPMADAVRNAGSVFLGHHSPESVGDYASGTNHTLPTNGHARAYSGISVDSFVKKITFQELTPEGLRGIGPSVEALAEAEGLTAHKRAVSIRLNK